MKAKSAKHKGRIRIIGGQWRGRKLPVPEQPGLRPSGDRVRETLFNWLQPVIQGSVCLDLFAGSGALGFEAASRGAGQVLMVEKSGKVVRHLRQQCRLLNAEQITVVQADALKWLERGDGSRFDLIFVDPPFQLGLQQRVLDLLAGEAWLRQGALIYLEQPQRQGGLQLAAGWSALKEKSLGEVRMQLLQVMPVPGEEE